MLSNRGFTVMKEVHELAETARSNLGAFDFDQNGFVNLLELTTVQEKQSVSPDVMRGVNLLHQNYVGIRDLANDDHRVSRGRGFPSNQLGITANDLDALITGTSDRDEIDAAIRKEARHAGAIAAGVGGVLGGVGAINVYLRWGLDGRGKLLCAALALGTPLVLGALGYAGATRQNRELYDRVERTARLLKLE